jgi:hypothetical protein
LDAERNFSKGLHDDVVGNVRLTSRSCNAVWGQGRGRGEDGERWTVGGERWAGAGAGGSGARAEAGAGPWAYSEVGRDAGGRRGGDKSPVVLTSRGEHQW